MTWLQHPSDSESVQYVFFVLHVRELAAGGGVMRQAWKNLHRFWLYSPRILLTNFKSGNDFFLKFETTQRLWLYCFHLPSVVIIVAIFSHYILTISPYCFILFIYVFLYCLFQWFWASIHMDGCADESLYPFTSTVSFPFIYYLFIESETLFSITVVLFPNKARYTPLFIAPSQIRSKNIALFWCHSIHTKFDVWIGPNDYWIQWKWFAQTACKCGNFCSISCEFGAVNFKRLAQYCETIKNLFKTFFGHIWSHVTTNYGVINWSKNINFELGELLLMKLILEQNWTLGNFQRSLY